MIFFLVNDVLIYGVGVDPAGGFGFGLGSPLQIGASGVRSQSGLACTGAKTPIPVTKIKLAVAAKLFECRFISGLLLCH
jgi:hypothetical protein